MATRHRQFARHKHPLAVGLLQDGSTGATVHHLAVEVVPLFHAQDTEPVHVVAGLGVVFHRAAVFAVANHPARHGPRLGVLKKHVVALLVAGIGACAGLAVFWAHDGSPIENT